MVIDEKVHISQSGIDRVAAESIHRLQDTAHAMYIRK